MSKFFLFPVVIFLIVGCSQSPEISFETLKQKGLESGVRNDTIFLDYTLRMTVDEMRDKTLDLIKSKKLKTDGKELIYTIERPKKSNLEFIVGADFYQEKLYELTLTPRMGALDHSKLVYLEMYELVKNYNNYRDNSIVDLKENVFNVVDGNRLVSLKMLSGVPQILYQDTKFYSELKKDKLKEFQDSKKDF